MMIIDFMEGRKHIKLLLSKPDFFFRKFKEALKYYTNVDPNLLWVVLRAIIFQ